MRSIGYFFITLLGLVAVVWALSLVGFQVDSYFGPKYEALKANIFHESAAYNDGMLRDLENLQVQYLSATKDQKEALRAVVLHRFSIYPKERLTPELRKFYADIFFTGSNLDGSQK